MGRNNLKAIWQLKKNGEIWNLFVLALAFVIGIVLEFIFKRTEIEDVTSTGDVVAAAMAYGYVIINLFIKVFLLADERSGTLQFTKKYLLYSLNTSV